MIPIQTTCEYTDDAIERAVERLGITNQSNEFKTFAVCHRDCFSKALVAKEHTKDEMEKWKSMAVTNAVAKAVSKRIDKVSLKDPDVVIFVVVLAVNDNGIKNTDNIPSRRLWLVVRDERVEGVHGEIERNRSYEFKTIVITGRKSHYYSCILEQNKKKYAD